MRLEARVLEGGEVSNVLVPLRSLLAFKKATKHGVDWWITQTKAFDSEVEGLDWEPQLAWQTMVDAADDPRDFETWSAEIEWAAIYSAADELDPSGGEETQTQESSPESSSTPDAAGPSSSGSTTTSSTPSGLSSEG